MKNVLGIMWNQNSTAALMIDGRIVASASEERFSRVKNDESYPKQAIEYVLREGGVNPKDLDAIAFIGTQWDVTYCLARHYSRFSVTDFIREMHKFWYPRFYEGKQPQYLDVFKDKLDLKQYPGHWKSVLAQIRKFNKENKSSDITSYQKSKAYWQQFRRDLLVQHLGIDPKKVIFVDHSTGHAMYAYYASPIRTDALVLTADAMGDENVNASVSIVKNGVMRRLYVTGDLIIARLYRYITLLLGLKPNEHEYKVMGLAPYAKEKYFQKPLKLFRDAQKVVGITFKWVHKPTDMYFYYREKLEGIRFDAIAGALQRYTEELLLQWTKNALRKTSMKHICFAGGVAMNVKVNMLMSRLPGVRSMFVNPTPDDASQAIAACMCVVYDDCRKKKIDPRTIIQPLTDAYLGPAITDRDVESLIKTQSLGRRYRVTRKVSPAKIASLLAAGKVIGRAAGRSEFGARALGNRSILADPRNTDVIQTINEKVKSRDFWMPFAPSILERCAKDYLIGYRNPGAPYMTVGFETTALAQKDLRAGLHPYDKTCRPQVILKGQNTGYEAIISAFEKKTGVGGVLNTSFNLHGEPIVQTAKDAFRVFRLTDLDALLLNDVLIEKKV